MTETAALSQNLQPVLEDLNRLSALIVRRWVNPVPTELMLNYFKMATYRGFKASRESHLLTISFVRQILSDANLRFQSFKLMEIAMRWHGLSSSYNRSMDSVTGKYRSRVSIRRLGDYRTLSCQTLSLLCLWSQAKVTSSLFRQRTKSSNSVAVALLIAGHMTQ